MAASRGIDPSRLIVEDQFLTTARNAIFTFDILAERYPQVKQIAIIPSDYHIAAGALLFGAEAILRNSDIEALSNASRHAPGGTLSAMFQTGALIELSGDAKTAFEIYCETTTSTRFRRFIRRRRNLCLRPGKARLREAGRTITPRRSENRSSRIPFCAGSPRR